MFDEVEIDNDDGFKLYFEDRLKKRFNSRIWRVFLASLSVGFTVSFGKL